MKALTTYYPVESIEPCSRKLEAYVKVTRNPKTVNIRWSIGSIDHCGAARDEIYSRLVKTKLMDAVHGIFLESKDMLSRRYRASYGFTDGVIRCVPGPVAEKLLFEIDKAFLMATREPVQTRYCFLGASSKS